MLTDILPGAAVAMAGVATVGWVVVPKVADAMPLGIAKTNGARNDELVQKAQVRCCRSASPSSPMLVAQGTSRLRLAIAL